MYVIYKRSLHAPMRLPISLAECLYHVLVTFDEHVVLDVGLGDPFSSLYLFALFSSTDLFPFPKVALSKSHLAVLMLRTYVPFMLISYYNLLIILCAHNVVIY